MHPARRVAVATVISSIALLVACTQARPTATAPVASDQRTDPTVQSVTPASPAASAWLNNVEAIATTDDNRGRRLAIKRQLDGMAIDWHSRTFDAEQRQGENILAVVNGAADAPLLLLGAHSDRVDVGHGATDNASGSAAVLALAERFKSRPLQNHRVAVAFWDLEEEGLLGAEAYIDNGGDQPAQYVNFDVFGWGDTIWMMTPDPAHPLVAASRAATDNAGLQLSAGQQYPPTDHRAFLEAGWPAVSYSLIGHDEIEGILDAYSGTRPDPMPKLMHVIHTPQDTLAQVDANAAIRGIDAIEAALRQWDAAGD